MATINRDGSGINIVGTPYDDNIYSTSNSNRGNFIDGLAGNDLISSNGKTTVIHGRKGKDTIYTCSNADGGKVYGDEDNDFITNNGPNSLVDGGKHDDNIINYGAGSKMYGSDDNDNIVITVPTQKFMAATIILRTMPQM